jgi:hypothetical protein
MLRSITNLLAVIGLLAMAAKLTAGALRPSASPGSPPAHIEAPAVPF